MPVVHCCLQVSDNPSMSTKSPEDPVLPKLVNGGQYASLEDALEDAPEDPCVCSEDPALDSPVSSPHCNCSSQQNWTPN